LNSIITFGCLIKRASDEVLLAALVFGGLEYDSTLACVPTSFLQENYVRHNTETLVSERDRQTGLDSKMERTRHGAPLLPTAMMKDPSKQEGQQKSEAFIIVANKRRSI
jgi:hypothetical protein